MTAAVCAPAVKQTPLWGRALAHAHDPGSYLLAREAIGELVSDASSKAWHWKDRERVLAMMGVRHPKGWDTLDAKDISLVANGPWANVLRGWVHYRVLHADVFVRNKVACVVNREDLKAMATMVVRVVRAELYAAKAAAAVCKGRAKILGKIPGLVRDLVTDARREIAAGRDFAVVARGCHLLHTATVQLLPDGDASFTALAAERAERVAAEAVKCWPRASAIWADVKRGVVDSPIWLDALKAFHVLPCSDADLGQIAERVRGISAGARPPDAATWAKFLAYVKTKDVVDYVRARKALSKMGGIEMGEQDMERILADPEYFPPRADCGKCWINKEFHYTRTADTWVVNAKDTTEVYTDASGLVHLTNELAHAIVRPHVLDWDLPVDDARHTPGVDKLVSVAAKAENTKPNIVPGL